MAESHAANQTDAARAIPRRWWIGVLALTLAVRGATLFCSLERLEADPDAYRELARALLDHGSYGNPVRAADGGTESRVQLTAYRPPLYPVLLALTGWWDRIAPLSVAWLHLLLGLSTVILVYQVGRQWGLGKAGWAAAALTACDPILLNQSVLVMTETLATFLAMLSLWTLARWQPGRWCANRVSPTAILPAVSAWSRRPHVAAGLAGGALALASLCRPTFLVWLAGVAAVWCVPKLRGRCGPNDSEVVLGQQRKTLERQGVENDSRHPPRMTTSVVDESLGRLGGGSRGGHVWSELAWFLLIAVAVLTPWGLRNTLAFGQPVWTTTHGGYTLWLANNTAFYRFLRQAPGGSVWDSRALDLQYGAIREQLGDIQADRWAREQALATIRSQPGMFAYASIARLGALWGLVPHQIDPHESGRGRWLRYAIGLWYAIVFGWALIGSWRLGRRVWHQPWLAGLVLVLSFSVVHAVYWSNLRMRAPLMPVVYLVAMAGVVARLHSRPFTAAAHTE